jgi:hypothetical protein
MKTRILTVAMALLVFAVSAWAAEAEYGGIYCAHQKRTTVIQQSPELTIFTAESWGIQTAESTFAPWKFSAVHCTNLVRIVNKARSSSGSCLWTDVDGDTMTGSSDQVPGQPGQWTFLGGTGKWQGIKGGGTYKLVGAAKPFPDETVAYCVQISGKYTLPQ